LTSGPGSAPEGALSETSASPATGSKYPIGEHYKVLDGFDVHKSSKKWAAVVVVEDQQGRRHMRLFKWIMKGDKWRVDLARFSVEYWNLEPMTQKLRELKLKYQIR